MNDPKSTADTAKGNRPEAGADSGWLEPALDYARSWLAYRIGYLDLPGCVMATAHRGALRSEFAIGTANLDTGEPLTTAHRFRVASHSKAFTSAAIFKLREGGGLRLDDKVGRFVSGFPREIADVTVLQLLTHSAGLLRDGEWAPHWQSLKPFFDDAALRSQLELPLVLPANSRFKYSNLGFGLAGLIVEKVTGESFDTWTLREIVQPSGLRSTFPDVPPGAGGPLSSGHGARIPGRRRRVFEHGVPTHAMIPATGFTSTAGDLAQFFASLDPAMPKSLLSQASRREMTRRHWMIPGLNPARWYGAGTMGNEIGGHGMYGHQGSFPGFSTITMHVPDWEVTVSLLTNAIDGRAAQLLDGVLNILLRFWDSGSPSTESAGWRGRWWSSWGPTDLVPVGSRILVADPAAPLPLQEVSVIEPDGPSSGRIVEADGIASFGEPAGIVEGADGEPPYLRLGGTRLYAEEDFFAMTGPHSGGR